MYNYTSHHIHKIARQSLIIIGLMVCVSQAFAANTAVKEQIKDLDERVSTIENQNLDGRVSTIESQNLDGRLVSIEQQNLPSRLNTIEGSLNSFLIPTVNKLVTDVDSLNTQIFEHEGRLNTHDSQLNDLQFYFEQINLHLLTPAPGAILVAVKFIDEDLCGVDLRGANLVAADLTGANLACGCPGPDCTIMDHANLGGANLHQAILAHVSLNYANLRGASMGWTNLRNTSLVGANLQGASIGNADLFEADLRLADLRGAEIFNVDGLGAVIWSNTICPDGSNSNDNDGDGFTCLTNLSGSIYGP